MDCPVALSLLRRGFQPRHRVFFADEETAIAAGFRPCGACQREKYRAWKARRGPLGGRRQGRRRVSAAGARRATAPSTVRRRPRGRARRRRRGVRQRRRASARRGRGARRVPTGPRAQRRPRRRAPTARPRPRPRRRPIPSTSSPSSSRSASSSCCASRARPSPTYVRRVLRRGWASGRDPVQAQHHLAAASCRRSRRALRDVRQGGGRDADRLHRPGGRRHPQRRPGRRRPSGRPGRCPAATPAPPRAALRAAGINVTLAPVADVPTSAGHRARRPRLLRRPGRRAATATKAAIDGWRAGGVAATAKHFPGLGGATTNTDFGSATIARRRADGRRPRAVQGRDRGQGAADHELARALPAARRAAHRVAVAGDPQGPAARRSSATDGVVITDSIEAKAVRATGRDRGDRRALDPRGQRHRAHDRPGLVDPDLSGAARRGPLIARRSALWCGLRLIAFSCCSRRSR